MLAGSQAYRLRGVGLGGMGCVLGGGGQFVVFGGSNACSSTRKMCVEWRTWCCWWLCVDVATQTPPCGLSLYYGR